MYVQRKIKAGIQQELASFNKNNKLSTTEGEVESISFDATNLADFKHEDMRDLMLESNYQNYV